MKLRPEDIEGIAFCFTLRERPLEKEQLWIQRGTGRVDNKALARHWIEKTKEDPELERRLLSLYLEVYSKYGVSGEQVLCVNAQRDYSTELPVLHYRHRAPKDMERRIRENYEVVKAEPPAQQDLKLPTTAEMASNFVGSMKNWALSGFKTVDEGTLMSRLKICMGCEWWDKDGFAGAGRCVKCGCATQAKLRLAPEKCPIGKWKEVV